MAALRGVFIVAMVFFLAMAPVMIQGPSPSSDGGPAYAAVAGSPLLQNDNDPCDEVPENGNGNEPCDEVEGNGNGNANGNDNDGNGNDNDGNDNDNDGDDNDNDDGDDNGNDNDDDGDDNDNDDGDDNDNDDGRAPPPPPPPPAPPSVASGCISGGQNVTLVFPGGSAAVTNPGPQGVEVRLARRDAATGPAGLLDALVFDLNVAACGGGGLGDPPPDLNLGIRYGVGANKAAVRILRLEGGQWTDQGITTVPDPDPNNPYVSATIPGRSRAYSVAQR